MKNLKSMSLPELNSEISMLERKINRIQCSGRYPNDLDHLNAYKNLNEQSILARKIREVLINK